MKKALFSFLIWASTSPVLATDLSLGKVIQNCVGYHDSSIRVLVVKNQAGTILTIIDGKDLLLSEPAQRRVIENSSGVTRIGYRAGDPLDGGADLRIFTRHSNPGVIGLGHLMTDVFGHMGNILVRCKK